MGKRRTHEEFVAEMKVLHADIEVVGEYTLITKHVLLKDKYGIVSGIPDNLLRGKKPTIKSAVDKNAYIIAQFRECHGDKYGYDKVEYVGSNIPVLIYCNECREYFSQTPMVHLRKCGCKKCASRKVHDRQRYTYEIFKRKAIEKHGDKYGYDDVIYINSHTKVKIYCKVHKKHFAQKPANHLFGEGCPDCMDSFLRNKFAKTTEQFKTEAIRKWNGLYSYDNVEYVNSNIKVWITCPIHGDFKQRPISHLKGHGCNKCVDRSLFGGYSRSDYIKTANGREGVMYKIRCWDENEDFYKIGITVTGVKLRFSGKVHMPYNYEIISEVSGEAGEIWDLELTEKRRHKKFKYIPLLKFGGETECFTKLL